MKARSPRLLPLMNCVSSRRNDVQVIARDRPRLMRGAEQRRNAALGVDEEYRSRVVDGVAAVFGGRAAVDGNAERLRQRLDGCGFAGHSGERRVKVRDIL